MFLRSLSRSSTRFAPSCRSSFIFAASAQPSFLLRRSFCTAGLTPEAMAKTLAADPVKLEAFVTALPNDAKKRVGLSWAMAELEDEFAKADFDADGHLTYQEFHAWAHRTVNADGPIDANVPASPQQLRALAIQTIIPFIGFGMTDNALMILSGDLIDSTICVLFGFSTLAAAALGNAMSNSLGMVLHGTIERFAGAIGLPDPRLTVGQRHAQTVKNVKMGSGILGVMIGCVLGMFPLLFISRDEEKIAEAKRSGDGLSKES